MANEFQSYDKPVGNPTGGQPAPLPSVDELKAQASTVADNARSSLNALASEARNKVNEVVDGQKAAGADHLSGLAHAAQTAAGDLDQHSPAVAQLVRGAASSVDKIAEDLRNSDVRDLVASVSTFARQQPVAFFAGSVLIGFAMARFFKSTPVAGSSARNLATPGYGSAQNNLSGAESGFREWSATHPHGPA